MAFIPFSRYAKLYGNQAEEASKQVDNEEEAYQKDYAKRSKGKYDEWLAGEKQKLADAIAKENQKANSTVVLQAAQPEGTFPSGGGVRTSRSEGMTAGAGYGNQTKPPPGYTPGKWEESDAYKALNEEAKAKGDLYGKYGQVYSEDAGLPTAMQLGLSKLAGGDVPEWFAALAASRYRPGAIDSTLTPRGGVGQPATSQGTVSGKPLTPTVQALIDKNAGFKPKTGTQPLAATGPYGAYSAAAQASPGGRVTGMMQQGTQAATQPVAAPKSLTDELSGAGSSANAEKSLYDQWVQGYQDAQNAKAQNIAKQTAANKAAEQARAQAQAEEQARQEIASAMTKKPRRGLASTVLDPIGITPFNF